MVAEIHSVGTRAGEMGGSYGRIATPDTNFRAMFAFVSLYRVNLLINSAQYIPPCYLKSIILQLISH